MTLLKECSMRPFKLMRKGVRRAKGNAHRADSWVTHHVQAAVDAVEVQTPGVCQGLAVLGCWLKDTRLNNIKHLASV